MTTITRTVTIEDDNEVEIELTLTFEVQKFVRGRYSSSFENCYPDEGGFAELISAKTSDNKTYVLTDLQIKRFEDEAFNEDYE